MGSNNLKENLKDLKDNMTPELLEVLERIETAFKASKPFIQLQDALVLYKTILDLPPSVFISQSEKHTGQN